MSSRDVSPSVFSPCHDTSRSISRATVGGSTDRDGNHSVIIIIIKMATSGTDPKAMTPSSEQRISRCVQDRGSGTYHIVYISSTGRA
jgi:hypothetical protein